MSPPAESPWPNPVAPSAETNNRTAKESAFAARMPCPPKPVVPKLKKPPSKPGISETPEPMNELETPDWPKDEFPKSEPPKPETPKRDPPKFAIERLEENDENDEKRDDAGRFVEERFEMKPVPDRRAFEDVAWFTPKDENPEAFRPKEAFLEFPNERHWLSFRPEFP
jgi:hypothetical protein